MYKKVLVPLDGSPLAECVLPHVEAIVKGCHSPEVVFMRVVEHLTSPFGTLSDVDWIYTQQQADKARHEGEKINMQEAKDYLIKVTSSLKYDIATVKTEVLTGKPAETIADYAEKNGVDLIIVATHGRSGISRWTMGSNADKILRSSCVPVFMIRAPGCVPGF